MIYFIKADNRIKIGYANNPIKRISNIQTSCPFILDVLFIIDGHYTKEQELHKMFITNRLNGEWFEYSDSIKNYIDTNINLDRRYEFGFIKDDFSSTEQILRLRKEHKLTLEKLGDKLNITKQSVKEMQDREKTGTITIKVLEKLADKLGYKFEYRFVPK